MERDDGDSRLASTGKWSLRNRFLRVLGAGQLLGIVACPDFVPDWSKMGARKFVPGARKAVALRRVFHRR